jgi:hypothetical protein
VRGFEFASLSRERVEKLDGHEKGKRRGGLLTEIPPERNVLFGKLPNCLTARAGAGGCENQQPQSIVRAVVVRREQRRKRVAVGNMACCEETQGTPWGSSSICGFRVGFGAVLAI